MSPLGRLVYPPGPHFFPLCQFRGRSQEWCYFSPLPTSESFLFQFIYSRYLRMGERVGACVGYGYGLRN